MKLNSDLTQRVVVHAAYIPWTASPIAGVERRTLERVGDEVARATTIVRYAPGSRFSPHTHVGGEEFIVLDGIFQDEHGDFPRGSYVRNPPTSSHTPRSEAGCTIFVKLWQFDPDDRRHVRCETDRMEFVSAADRPGVELMPLFHDDYEDVRIERWAPGAHVNLHVPGGIELLVLDGGFREGGDSLEAHAWLRIPAGGCLRAEANTSGCRLWIKSGHLGPRPEAWSAAAMQTV
jgi:anti-sigma factor ChrR (cupin superfamily)